MLTVCSPTGGNAASRARTTWYRRAESPWSGRCDELSAPSGAKRGRSPCAALGLAATLGAALLAATGLSLAATSAWLTGQLLGGLDGPVARQHGTASDLGGYLDVVADTIAYAALPIGVAIGIDDHRTWLTVAALLGTFFLNTIS